MRHVYPSAMVAHLWANGDTSDIRNSTRNIFAYDGAIYSYGRHYVLGAFVKRNGRDILLLNAASYSPTTNRHQSHVRRALSRAQHDAAVYVPGMCADDLRDLPKLASACVSDAGAKLEKAQRARTNRPHYLTSAASRLDAARQILTFAGNARAARALPTVAEDESKTATAETLRRIKGAEYAAQAQRERERVRQCAATMHDAVRSVQGWQIGSDPATRVCQYAHDVITRAEIAQNLYRQAGKRAPAEIAAAIREAKRIGAEYESARAAESAAREAARINDARARIVAELARHRRNPERGAYVGGALDHRSHFPELARRYIRVNYGRELHDAIATMRDTIATMRGASYDPHGRSYTIPNSGHFLLTARRARDAGMETRYWETIAAPLVAEINQINAERAAQELARNAASIERWRNGERVYLAQGVPTMARINGATVETSRGASVPLSHAARLVRIAERAAARGGQTWARGAGPMVGAFRVESIGADMSAVIGCHEFSAAESVRIVAQIKRTAEYLGATEGIAA